MAIGTTKVIASALITGTVGGSITVGAYFLSNNTSARDKLISEGFKLAKGDDWATIITEHNKDDSTNTFSHTNKDERDAKWLENKCKEALDNKDESSYKSARQWCTKTEAISNILTNGKRKVLNNDDNTEEKEDWNKKLTKLKEDTNANKKIVVEWDQGETEKIKKIKAECKKIVAITNADKTFDEKYELAKEYCSI